MIGSGRRYGSSHYVYQAEPPTYWPYFVSVKQSCSTHPSLCRVVWVWGVEHNELRIPVPQKTFDSILKDGEANDLVHMTTAYK